MTAFEVQDILALIEGPDVVGDQWSLRPDGIPVASVSVAPLHDHVSHVVEMCSQKQMRRHRVGFSSATARVIAVVEDVQTGRNGTVDYLPNETMNTRGLIVDGHDAVAPAIKSKSPRPAAVRVATVETGPNARSYVKTIARCVARSATETPTALYLPRQHEERCSALLADTRHLQAWCRVRPHVGEVAGPRTEPLSGFVKSDEGGSANLTHGGRGTLRGHRVTSGAVPRAVSSGFGVRFVKDYTR